MHGNVKAHDNVTTQLKVKVKGQVSANGKVKFKVNAHVNDKVKLQAKVLTIVLLMLKFRPNLRSRIGLQFEISFRLTWSIFSVSLG